MPVYYSAADYFKRTVKFRTLTIQPELRYWFARNRNSWYVGAHAGIGWFNYAVDGGLRYQDHGWGYPALGGGLGAGYRFALGHKARWKMELALGAGVYRAVYDTFDNVHNGQLVSSKLTTTFVGVDNAAVSVVYVFNRKK